MRKLVAMCRLIDDEFNYRLYNACDFERQREP